MATIPGSFLLAASSPYSRRGELWRAYRQHHGNEESPVLCWQAPTRTMNPTVPQPFSPETVVIEFTDLLRSYHINQIVGDRWGGEWVAEAFRHRGVSYVTSERPKSAIYNEFLPKLNSRRVELLDSARLVSQLCALERRTGRGTGRDSIDHPPGGRDDVCNSVAGVMVELLAGLTGQLVITDDDLRKAREFKPGQYYSPRQGGVFF